MNKPTLLLTSALSLPFALACVPSVDLEAEREALRRADSAYTQAAATKDVDAWAGMYAQNANLYPPDDSTVSGSEAIRAYGAAFTAMEGFSATFHPLALEVGGGGDMGYTLSHFVITYTGPDGQPVTEQGRDLHVWRKQADGTWKIVIDIWNSDQPAAGQ